jgi:nucleoside-diphosphate-sugar epimerase
MLKKKLLVCGATGFIGRNLVKYFSSLDEYEVIGIYNKKPKFAWNNLKWKKADLTNSKDVHRVLKGIDIIVQAAATTSGSKDIVSKPMIHVTDNMIMNSLIFRSAHENNVKNVVFFSCTVMYRNSQKPLKEDDFKLNEEIHPKYFGVGWTKVSLEKQCEFYSRIGKTKYTVLRHSNIYGPDDKFDLEKSHVCGATITKVLSSEKKGKIKVWGTGEEERDLLYVDDLVNSVGLAIKKQKTSFGLFNVGYGKSISINKLVEKIIFHSGLKVEIEHDTTQPTIKTSLSLNCSKIKKHLGWKRNISHDEGLKRTIKWWRKNFETSKTR